MAYQELHKPDQLRHEKYKGEDDQSEESMAENFADNVTVKNAHGATGECNTPAPAARECSCR